MTVSWESALIGLRAAADVERAAAGHTRGQRRQLARVVGHRLVEAGDARATIEQLADAVRQSVPTTRDRLRAARAREPEQPVTAPDVWLDVPRCGRSLPPPARLSARCRQPQGHDGDCRR